MRLGKAFVIGMIMVRSAMFAQTVDLRFLLDSFDGTNYYVIAEIKADSSTFELGSSTFAFTYDSSAVTLSSTHTPLNFSGGNYQTQSLIVNSPNGRVGTLLKLFQAGTIVQVTWMQICRLHFTVKNPAGQSNLAWNSSTTVIFTPQAATIPEDQLLGLNTNPLPVELVSFSAIPSDRSVKLVWRTATETQNLGFDVERKSETSDWTRIGFAPGFGTSAIPHDHSFVDDEVPPGEVSYRLKQIDVSGTFEYSDVVSVRMSLDADVVLEQNYPNPFNPTTMIHYRIGEAGNVRLMIVDLLGRTIGELVNEYCDAGSYSIQFDATRLASGTYICRMDAGRKTQLRKLVLKK